jgi:hypothetical protein
MKAKGRNPINDKAASKIAGRMLGVQNKFATIMNKGFSKLSTAKRKIVVICFTLIGGGLSIYYICEAMTGAGKEKVVEMEKFEIPKHYKQQETEASPNVFVDEETWNKVQFFKHYMDSLKKKDDPEYYKIMKERPGLLDSIRTLEQIYYSQKLK